MKYLKSATINFLLYLFLSLNLHGQSILTESEREWVREHPVITVHNEMNWAPFNFNKNGIPQGYSIDYMNMVAEQTGLQIEYISGPSWSEFQEMIQKGELDVMLNTAYSEERDSYLNYTDPYLEFAPSIYIKDTDPTINSIEEVYGKTFAVPKGFYYEDLLKDYPQVKILHVKDTSEAILAVSRGQADIMLDMMPIVNYMMSNLLVTNLKTGGSLGIGADEPVAAHIVVLDDQKELHSIIQKGLQAIPWEETAKIKDKWLGFSTEEVLMLSQEEQSWLIKLSSPLRVANEMDWPPFDFSEKGIEKGFSIDLIKEITGNLGIELEFINGYTWAELMDKFKAGEIDIMPAIYKSPERHEYALFTSSYATNPSVLIVHSQTEGK